MDVRLLPADELHGRRLGLWTDRGVLSVEDTDRQTVTVRTLEWGSQQMLARKVGKRSLDLLSLMHALAGGH